MHAWRLFYCILSLVVLSITVPGYSCCSLAPAEFSDTKGWVGTGVRNGRTIHLLAYQNSVVNDAKTPGGNAMFLPIPAVPGSMSHENMIDTSKFPHFLDAIATAIKNAAAPKWDISVAMSSAGDVEVFNSGMYTVVLAKDAEAIPGALKAVPADKRPTINPAIFSAYKKWYPGWTFALCCFNNTKKVEADPLLWWYEPQSPNQLFFPGLDCHTGAVPKLDDVVDVDHIIAVSDSGYNDWLGTLWHPTVGVEYTDQIPAEIRQLLPDRVIGKEFHGKMPQGDFVFDVADVRADKFILKRVLPPGAKI